MIGREVGLVVILGAATTGAIVLLTQDTAGVPPADNTSEGVFVFTSSPPVGFTKVSAEWLGVEGGCVAGVPDMKLGFALRNAGLEPIPAPGPGAVLLVVLLGTGGPAGLSAGETPPVGAGVVIPWVSHAGANDDPAPQNEPADGFLAPNEEIPFEVLLHDQDPAAGASAGQGGDPGGFTWAIQGPEGESQIPPILFDASGLITQGISNEAQLFLLLVHDLPSMLEGQPDLAGLFEDTAEGDTSPTKDPLPMFAFRVTITAPSNDNIQLVWFMDWMRSPTDGEEQVYTIELMRANIADTESENAPLQFELTDLEFLSQSASAGQGSDPGSDDLTLSWDFDSTVLLPPPCTPTPEATPTPQQATATATGGGEPTSTPTPRPTSIPPSRTPRPTSIAEPKPTQREISTPSK